VTGRALSLLIVCLCLCAALFTGGACHRRRGRNGACAAHIDCDPGYDCREGRCAKRAPFPGSVAEPEAPANAEPSAPGPAAREAPPRRDDQPAPPPPTSPANAPPLPPAPQLPAWKARLKNI
jgi:hypothetical protein